MRYTYGRGMSAMSSTKGIIDIYLGQTGERTCEGRIVLFFEGEYDLVSRVCLVAEGSEIISEVVIQPLERLQDRDGGAKFRRR